MEQAPKVQVKNKAEKISALALILEEINLDIMIPLLWHGSDHSTWIEAHDLLIDKGRGFLQQ
jgi:hypothetical protein